MNQDLMKSKYELIITEIDEIDKGLTYRFDDYGDYQTVSLEQAQKRYTEILDNLDIIPGLSEDEKMKVHELVKLKINELPERMKQETQVYEEQKKQMYEQSMERRKQAWEDAKVRYKSQSVFKKIKYIINGTRPKDFEKKHDIENITLNTINELYGGKDGR